MATVKLTTPFSGAVVEVDGARVEKLVALGWVKVSKPRRKSDSDSSESESHSE